MMLCPSLLLFILQVFQVWSVPLPAPRDDSSISTLQLQRLFEELKRSSAENKVLRNVRAENDVDGFDKELPLRRRSNTDFRRRFQQQDKGARESRFHADVANDGFMNHAEHTDEKEDDMKRMSLFAKHRNSKQFHQRGIHLQQTSPKGKYDFDRELAKIMDTSPALKRGKLSRKRSRHAAIRSKSRSGKRAVESLRDFDRLWSGSKSFRRESFEGSHPAAAKQSEREILVLRDEDGGVSDSFAGLNNLNKREKEEIDLRELTENDAGKNTLSDNEKAKILRALSELLPKKEMKSTRSEEKLASDAEKGLIQAEREKDDTFRRTMGGGRLGSNGNSAAELDEYFQEDVKRDLDNEGRKHETLTKYKRNKDSDGSTDGIFVKEDIETNDNISL